MSEKQFVVEKLEILNEENEWKGEYWWAVVNTQRVEDCFECRNKEVALKLCDLLNRQTRIIKGQDLEIQRLQNLAMAMSGVLREEFGVYDVFDRTKDKKI